MGLLDELKKKAGTAAQNAANSAVRQTANAAQNLANKTVNGISGTVRTAVNNAAQAPQAQAQTAATPSSSATSEPVNAGTGRGSQTFTFETMPQNLAELKALPEADLSTPFKTAALTVLALCRYGSSKDDCIEMLNFLRGPRPLTAYDIQFLRDRLSGFDYLPLSFFEGTSPENDYTPTQPYTITVFEDTYSYQNSGYCKLNIRSSGADSPRQLQLRCQSGTTWRLWENYLLPGIRAPKSSDPWA